MSGKALICTGELERAEGIFLSYSWHLQPASEETLVFIHAHSVDQRMWQPQIEYFQDRYSILVYDLRGYGKSSLPREEEPFLHADDLLALLDRLEIAQAHLIGLSLGSFVALDFWALYPDKVRSVTVASGAIPDAKADPPALLVTDLPSFKRTWFQRLLEGCGEDHNGYQAKLWTMIEDWSGWQSTHREPDSILGEQVEKRLEQIEELTPLCILNGEQDFVGAHRSAERLLRCKLYAEWVELPSVGHFSNMESPNAFHAALDSFLSKGVYVE